MAIAASTGALFTSLTTIVKMLVPLSGGEPLSVNFADYLMPTAREVPAPEVLITEDAPSPLNPLGLKGAGEGGINAVGAAIASAIDDAVGTPGAITRLPVTPQRLREILKRAGR